MEYHLDATLRQMPGKATWNGSLNSYRAVLDQLEAEHQDMLQQSFLWPLYELRHLQFSGQIIDALLCRLLSPVDGDALHFVLFSEPATRYLPGRSLTHTNGSTTSAGLEHGSPTM